MAKTGADNRVQDTEVLDHKPVPGYRTAFHIAIGLSSLYLLYIFAVSI